jgi:hypothetical protein
MPRSPIAAVGALVLALVLLIPTTASADVGTGAHDSGKQSRLSWAAFRGELTDLNLSNVGPFDQAQASAMMIGFRSSTFVLHVSGIDADAVGDEFGAHLHIGTCVVGDPVIAGNHYNIDVVNGVALPEISDKTEVWLDFVVDGAARGQATAHVPWVPAPGEHAIVIHEHATDENGVAGPRRACIPLIVH